MRWFRFAVLVLVASLLQTGLIRVLAVPPSRPDIRPDLLLILLVFFASRAKSTDAILASFALGFAADLSNPILTRLMGPRIISFGLFGSLLSDLSSTISPRRMTHLALTIFLMGSLTTGLSYLLALLRAETVVTAWRTGLLWQPLYSAIVGPFLFLPVGWWMRMYGKGPRRRRRGRL
ncbi:MAG: rod shape-determining protein MreD [Planctomycetes bacterium]|nr:rod shape-determining protein MreD [Planctomycetota bacterium]